VLGPQITNMVFSGPWLGSGGVTLSTSNQFTWTSGGLSNFSGTLSLGNNSGIFTFNNATNSTTCRGSAAATFDLGIGSAILNNLNGSNATYNLGALMGGAGTILSGRSTNSAAPPGTTYSIGANGASTTFSGRITDGLDVVTLVKVGAGTLNLNGTNTSTGSITVSNGTLGGKGVISGPLTVTAGGTLSPGTSIGTFTVSNSATFAGTLLMELNQTNAPASNDLLVVTGTITGGGSLVVTNIGPDIINGSSFKLFNKAVTGFSVSLPATSPGGSKPYVWQNNLGVDGSIKLLNGGAPVNTNPTNITFSLSSGTNLSLGWPSDHIGWALMSNSIGLPLTNAWFLVPGSQLTNQELLNADTSKTNVFFRMSYP
jgi:autotransporter-associated beta strand protein